MDFILETHRKVVMKMNTYCLILCAFLLLAPNISPAADSLKNNFTMIDPGNNPFAGANDVSFSLPSLFILDDSAYSKYNPHVR